MKQLDHPHEQTPYLDRLTNRPKPVNLEARSHH